MGLASELYLFGLMVMSGEGFVKMKQDVDPTLALDFELRWWPVRGTNTRRRPPNTWEQAR